jgi:hypothetical protein
VLTVDEIPRSTIAAWMLYLHWSAGVRETNLRYLDVVAGSRTAFAEVYRYPADDGGPQTWNFSVDERRRRDVEDYAWTLRAPGDDVDYPTWRSCFDAAVAAVLELRGCSC